MFKDMAADTYLASAGIADDWPYGRGCWQSDDKQCIVWFGEEDQLRIMCMKRGTKLNEVFDRLKTIIARRFNWSKTTIARRFDRWASSTLCVNLRGVGRGSACV